MEKKKKDEEEEERELGQRLFLCHSLFCEWNTFKAEVIQNLFLFLFCKERLSEILIPVPFSKKCT